MNKSKIYFLSDVHLGSSSHVDGIALERKLCRWFDVARQDATAIYLLGDIFDYWFEYKTVVPRGFTRVLGKLSELTDAGIEIHFFIGNHDIWLTDYLEKECGLIIHREPLSVRLGQHNFFLAHGDGLGDNSRMFLLLRKLFRNKFLRACFAAIHPRWTVALAHRWSNHSRATGGVIDYLGEHRERLVRYAKEQYKTMPETNYYVFGHRHIMLNLAIAPQAHVVVLGDWIRFFSYAVYDGESVELKVFDETP